MAATAAKLFVAGAGDAAAAADAQRMYDQSVPPKRVEIVPSDDHGTDLLEGSQGPNVRAVLAGGSPSSCPCEAPERADG